MIEDFKITSYFIIDKMSLKKLSLLKGDENFFQEKSSEGVLYLSYCNKPYYARKTPPSSKNKFFESTSPLRAGAIKNCFAKLTKHVIPTYEYSIKSSITILNNNITLYLTNISKKTVIL